MGMNEIEGCPTVTLKITYPDGYPNELAEIEFDEEDYENFEDEDLSDLKKTLHETMDENRGDVMTFLVISAAIEWLELNHTQKEELKEQRLRAEKDAAEAILTKKLVGTKVTVENFMAWKMEFDAKRLEGKIRKNKDGKEKLSGRELFTQNATLNESDIQFISSGKLYYVMSFITNYFLP